jgi:16S rRNA (adenine1518-N6/adenine1519-N6)-dimethyltransferase
MEDIFDIVNERDQVIGAAPRSMIHQAGHLHRATHIWIFNSQGLLLIQLRSSAKDRHPRTWDSSACGHVDSGEDYLTAARRECCEELGLLHPPDLHEIAYCTDTAALDQEFVKVFLARHEGPFLPRPGEVDEVRWINPASLTPWMDQEPNAFAPSFIHLWHRYGPAALRFPL